ncbi:DUF3859 domain-containing protein [Pelagicoccus enzymogenes]|uniref:DUF3859 domain-containing protein n=1 Tax=Pelagicoccus enzymogenes TaxID=2773457 RepID=UPI00280ECF30|nr:DUF3859 domain-containing protein [Pelagicoccus enzymogenes]MDQ8199155.1 DUF3859 domain-containing protein [Pelagicoccus enzymogenes]
MKAALLLVALVPTVFPFLEVPFDATLLSYNHIQRIGGESVPDDDTPTGGKWVDDDYIILQYNTWTIPNCLETGLQLEVRFDNVPEDLTHLDLEVRYPRMQLPNGGSKERFRRREPMQVYDGSTTFYFGYYFDHEYEQGLGDWIFTLSHEGEEIYRAKFTVVDCDEKAETTREN